MAAERAGIEHEVIAARRELRGRVERPADHDQVAPHPRARIGARVSADNRERSVDDRGAGEPRVSKDNDHVAVHAPFDGRIGADEHQVPRGVIDAEGVGATDADDLAPPGKRAEPRQRRVVALGRGRRQLAGRGPAPGGLSGQRQRRHHGQKKQRAAGENRKAFHE